MHGGYRPGSGRPKGTRSKASIEREAILDFIRSKYIEAQSEIIEALLREAKLGNVPAIRELNDRTFGRAKEFLELSQDENNPLEIIIKRYDPREHEQSTQQSGDNTTGGNEQEIS